MVWRKIGTALLFVVSTIAGLNGPANAGIIHATTPDEVYQSIGAQYESVGWMRTFDINGNHLSRLSGVLIASNWVLTAAHLNSNAAGVSFGLGPNSLTNQGQTQTSTTIYRHPSYQGLGQGYDLALIHFADSFADVTPANLYLGEFAIGMEMTMVGYGRTGVPGGETFYDGNKRGGTGWLDQFGALTWTPNFFSSVFYAPNHSQFRPTGILMAPGDSGGGFFINGELAGITALNSSGLGYHGMASASRIDNDWIWSTTSSVPEPSSMALLLVSCGILATRRIRR